MSNESSSVRIEGVCKSFGSVQVLKSTEVDIASGEFFSLLGPSGCGKTTLLNILGGLEKPDRGRVVIGGQDVTDLPPERRPTNMVFQSYAIFPHLSVARNIAYGLRSRRLSPDETRRRVGKMLELVHLEGMGDRDSSALSGGQRQRVALARALILEPKVLLLDESLAALDRRLREAMQVELRQLQRMVGITFIFVTHDQDEALAMSDRIAVMGEGRILQVARPAELYHQPVSRAVAEFIGSINLIPVESVAEAVSGTVLDAGRLGTFNMSSVIHRHGDGGALLALRPEALHVQSERPGPEMNAIAADVLEHVFLGDRSYLRLAVAETRQPMVAACPTGSHWSAAHAGDRVWLGWAPDQGLLLPDK